MDKIIRELILFIISFIVVFLLYEIFVVRKAKSKKKPKEPIEVTYLVNKYKLDLKNVNYKKLLRIISIVSSFDIAVVVAVILLFDNFLLEVVVGFITMLIMIVVSYHLVYLVYKKKGMIKNESKRNRK